MLGDKTLLSRFQGCLLAAAVGDAVGELAQHHPEWDLAGILKADLLYTDDTALTLALAEAILAPGHLTTKKIGDAFLRTMNAEPSRGYGGSPLIYYSAELHGIGYWEARDRVNTACRSGEGSLGDGAAMRIAPVALYYSGSRSFAAKVRLSCDIDHNHPIALDSCRVVAVVISLALGSGIPDNERLFAKLHRHCQTSEMARALTMTKSLLGAGVSANEAAVRLGNTSRSTTDAHAVVPFALFCFLKNPESFESCLLDSISSPGDSDTIAAIAGAMAGAHLGVEAIPERYLVKLERGERIRELSGKLYRKKRGIEGEPWRHPS